MQRSIRQIRQVKSDITSICTDINTHPGDFNRFADKKKYLQTAGACLFYGATHVLGFPGMQLSQKA